MGNKVPVDFEYNGWSKANMYMMSTSGITDKVAYQRERFRRAAKVQNEWQKTPEGRKAQGLAIRQAWEERAQKAKEQSETAEILLLERIVEKEKDGMSTATLISGCINLIARELAKRGAQDIDKLSIKDLIQISNSLLGLTKAASAVKKDNKWQPQVQVNNVTVNNTSKTGGVVGGLQDVIEIQHEEKPAEVKQVP